jgi:ATP-dependent exoDNAse (exonuclease V) beta subunit
MTVHKAKGLEFPVVILADMTAKLAPLEASRHLDASKGLCAMRIGGWSPLELLHQQAMEQAREREEGVRVAYVAATRARDVLVVPAVGDAPFDGGWLSPLDLAVYPSVATRRHAAPAPACPSFKRDSVLQRPDAGIASAQTVSPGLHQFDAESREPYDVVWWDPSALNLGVEAPFGLRRQELIAKDVAPEVVAAGQRAYIGWRDARDEALKAGTQPSVRVRTATEWAVASGSEASELVEVVRLDAAPGRPSGTRFGTLVHAVLATVPLDASPATVHAITATQSRVVGATADESSAARGVVEAALRHPLFDAARTAVSEGTCLRETPVTLTVGDQLVEGTVDFAFQTADGTTVIDFKTDRVDGVQLERYQRQVGLYAAAIGRVNGEKVRAVLMMV